MDAVAQLNTSLAGRYEVERQVGAGGMATVYLARDVRHNRRVALKVLRPDLGAVLGVERFLSEIQVTANLQHPNLLPLFDSGEANGLLFYVMPFVEGESLRARLEREKQLPIDEAIRITTAIASALEYAHGQGVIHRDLKPENILVHAGQPVIADFGIALAVSNAGGGRITQTGISLGTPQYMSPEQATGDRNIDRRTDIYSLGAIAYEMLTGEAPHTGTTAQAVIARVLTETPRSARVTRPNVPEYVDVAIMRALEKLPADRFSTAQAFSEALSGARHVTISAIAPPDVASAAIFRVTPRRLATMALIAAAGVAVGFLVRPMPRAPSTVPTEFEIQLPESLEVSTERSVAQLALSPDGSALVFQARVGNGPPSFYVRRLDDRAIQPIRGTEGGNAPRFAADGSEIVYLSAAEALGAQALKKVSVGGGTPRAVSDSSFWPGSWGARGEILYSFRRSIGVLSGEGAAPEIIAVPDSARGHRAYEQPDLLPGGKAALITLRRGLNTLDSAFLGVVTIPEGKVTELGIRGTNPRYANGHIFYATAEGSLLAVPFAPASMRVTGDPIPVAEAVQVGPGGEAAFAVADNGTVAYIGGASGVGTPRSFVAVSRTGTERPIAVRPGFYDGPRVSPDGRQIAFAAHTSGRPGGRNPDIWRYDLQSNVLTRVTTDSSSARPFWSAKGDRLAYVVNHPPGDTVAMWRPLYATGQAEAVMRAPKNIAEIVLGPPHGYNAAGISGGANGSYDIYVAHSDSLVPASPFADEAYHEFEPSISADGRLIAWTSNRSGTWQIYVRPLSGNVTELQVSVDGGSEPVWAPAGRELFYRSATSIMSVRLSDGARPEVIGRDALFRDPYVQGAANANYDVFPGASEFLMLTTGSPERRHLIVRMNWSPVRRAVSER